VLLASNSNSIPMGADGTPLDTEQAAHTISVNRPRHQLAKLGVETTHDPQRERLIGCS
jgi:hypothetical protein